MIYCKYCRHYDVQTKQVYCDVYHQMVDEHICIHCPEHLWRYKDLDIGQCFFDTATEHFGIKLSSRSAYNLDDQHVYGFAGNHANDSEDRRYLKAHIEVW